jgi:opacity protein-like surface antigen
MEQTAMKPILLFALVCAAVTASAAPAAVQPKPYAAIAGRWTSNATLSSTTADPSLQGVNYSWTGQFYGLIENSGRMTFRANNGCQLSGQATPFASTTLWSMEADLSHCPFAHLDQHMFGNIKREGSFLVIKATASPFAVGKPPIAYEMKATLSRY